MSYLETKRNAIMNAVASGQLTNLLANTTWQEGYYNTDGTINTNGGNSKVMYESEYIDVEVGKKYLLIADYSNSSAQYPQRWYKIPQYDSNEDFVSCKDWASADTWMWGKTTVSWTTFAQPKIRVSIYTYGNCDITLLDWEELLNSTNTENIGY